MLPVGGEVVAVDKAAEEKALEIIGGHEHLIEEARQATQAELELGFWDSVKLYPKACAWSILLSTTIVMEGFDLALIGSFFGFPRFVEKYGTRRADGTYNISAAWQSGLTNGVQVGSIIGLQINGWASTRFGYKKTMLVALVFMNCFIFITFFAPNIETLLVGEILCGMPWGVFQTLSTAYASEVVPVRLRPVLTSYVNLTWVFGQLLSQAVLRGLLDRTDQWAYRIPFALQWIWPVPILIGVCFAPESPWWLVRNDKDEEARRTLRRLVSNKHSTYNVDAQLAMIKYTNALEKAVAEGTSYLDCFKGTDLRRTEVVCGAWLVQAICGSSFQGFASYFFQRAGMAADRSFDMTMGLYALGAVGTVGSWFAMNHIGRRTLFLGGLAILFVLLVIIGGVGFVENREAGGWAVGSLLIVFTFFYDFTIGPVTYTLVAELSSTRLRSKSVVLARNLYNIANIVNNVIVPRMLNVDAWNWGAKSAFWFAVTNVFCFAWALLRLPEPKGRTYGELDVLFEQRVPAWKFASTNVDQFRPHADRQGAPSPSEKEKDASIEHHP